MGRRPPELPQPPMGVSLPSFCLVHLEGLFRVIDEQEVDVFWAVLVTQEATKKVHLLDHHRKVAVVNLFHDTHQLLVKPASSLALEEQSPPPGHRYLSVSNRRSNFAWSQVDPYLIFQGTNQWEPLQHIGLMRGVSDVLGHIRPSYVHSLVFSTFPERATRDIIDLALVSHVHGRSALAIELGQLLLGELLHVPRLEFAIR
jgi:hypothetical protein